ncbi:MAG TPA: aminotransferase class I/II-fold pyridoxal phosphate-dependent enzyme [Phycisphaerae bacterium]|nr:aminotransferase class I/II-fold pyridoxal phosphate-dependent enzyme [Phycisphaerae bacterium]HRY70242.1 aminotransferase class I/II-fold pyridoxal phosphate-dependent enzyme [Phycisphaerae bacterium]HSA27587.1 aminotransferase class I/II-fold pyridoxal phosphate-dependent enzyme [Phycisphaerae bacterium]
MFESKISTSERIKRLPPYLFARINALKHRKRQDGIDIIDLGMGNPTDPTPQPIVDKLCEAVRDPRNHRYSVSRGVLNLRRDVARHYREHYGVELDPEQEVIACIGSKEGISHLLLAMLGPGDTAVVGDPAFPIHVYGVALAGANVISVQLGNDDAFLERIRYVVAHLFPKPKVIILNYPHNPTAMTVNLDFFEKVVGLANEHGVAVIHDFAYGQTCFNGYKAPSFLTARGAKEIGVEFTTMSKPYNMAGWRIGFCAGNATMVNALGTIKGYYDYGIFQPVQIASIIAMRHCQEDVVRQQAIYQERRDVVVSGCRKLGWEAEVPRASMFVWARVKDEHLAGQSSIDFVMRMLEEAEVALAPGRAFGENGESYVRIALVENEQRLRQAMRQLDRALNKKAMVGAGD